MQNLAVTSADSQIEAAVADILLEIEEDMLEIEAALVVEVIHVALTVEVVPMRVEEAVPMILGVE